MELFKMDKTVVFSWKHPFDAFRLRGLLGLMLREPTTEAPHIFSAGMSISRLPDR
jgi:hypothetical protein